MISLASFPTFNPNLRPKNLFKKDPSNSPIFNRAVQGIYELGSVFKIFPVALGMETNVINPKTEFNTHNPTILKKDNSNINSDQIISKKTSENIRLILEKVVSKGTARETDFGGYLVGGKTGTAEKPNPIQGGYYENKVISTFASAFPISTGDFVLVVTLDEPENNFGSESYRYASKTVVPVAAKIISRIAPLLNLKKE